MKAIPHAIPDVLILEPSVLADERGFFFESFNQAAFEASTGLRRDFVQDNHSHSARGVLRGLHYQVTQAQGKLVRVCAGEIYDVAVDLRRGSSTFGKWVAAILSAENKRQLWIPEGFAHGFLTLSNSADVLYKATDYYAPQHQRCIRWDDPALAIPWPCQQTPLLSEKDRGGASLADAETC
ncbi:dTDP-4-dehydrorhamnose 3,5-epimerase [Achromobacter denitrificans]|uniref:dTDP-4-dehydrorhamnose 3,5-epimerase n=1 Tax=Achromobacter denitrificans TaxID=32002 RepID=UPI00078837F1|nr:dTDP-4-dehydrorhamnose 3,5-epimerase [Achromobacter denitrificans]OLU01490.1 dTDP-4-dehydrorhamnose 3,5-epimerase [Achromobacter denitrificans]QKH43993.1 dTDP-4-dehydrorhamnose 3,5-epimerase [Achromobacter denitrificans]QKH48866.1 dTDP-4-dehydrorhamnose 3,5-epimerase [Achromobacter denitrificans]CAB3701713.1 dTDP-4-dehydrorhamnose 3,5-epimerase [Achromobacter denitrificans]SUU09337.1 dTDP-4-dehydrorhamnose 3,5-epimerase [Achromobacter denitrificans]